MTTVAALLLLLPLPLSAQQRWAVVVGVNDYASFGDEIGGDLHGPVNDARAVSDALVRRWDFEPSRVRLLLDGAATREAIRSALQEWIPGVAQPGDVVVFYFAGHGSQSWDDDGDESDGLDETIAPHDVLPASTENDITDDDLRLWLGTLERQQVVVILDSCHSGTATRVVTPFVRPRLLARRVEALPPPAAVTARSAASAPPQSQAATDADLQSAHVLEIAASQPDQAAMDVAWPLPSSGAVEWGGAFTRFLVQQLWSDPPGNSYRTIFEGAARQLKLAGFAQDPFISAAPALRDQTAFGVGRSVARPPASSPELRILGSRGDGITVNAPVGAELVPGVRLAGPSGEFEIAELFSDSARAFRVAPAPASSAPGASAAVVRVLSRPPPPAALRLSIGGVEEGIRAEVAQVIARLPGIELIDASAGIPDITLDGGTRTLQLAGRDGILRGVIAPYDPQLLTRSLEREIDFRRLASLSNPAQTHRLDLQFGTATSIVRLGQAVELRVATPIGGYLTVVDLAPDGTTTLLFPNDADPSNRVEAGTTVRLPTPAMTAAGVRMQVQEPAGSGLVRVIITPVPLGLSGDARGAVTPAAVHAALLRLFAGGPATGGSGTGPEWGTAALVYDVQP